MEGKVEQKERMAGLLKSQPDENVKFVRRLGANNRVLTTAKLLIMIQTSFASNKA